MRLGLVDTAAEKEEAEALLAHTEYAVVIADLRLTGIYGMEGLDIIAVVTPSAGRSTRVVLLTGYGSPGDRGRGPPHGAPTRSSTSRCLSPSWSASSPVSRAEGGVKETPACHTVCAWCNRVRGSAAANGNRPTGEDLESSGLDHDPRNLPGLSGAGDGTCD